VELGGHARADHLDPQPFKLQLLVQDLSHRHQVCQGPGSPAAPASELRLRNVAFEVHDLQAAVDRAATDGYRLVGGIGEYEGSWRMAYVRGPEGIIVSLAERIG